MKMSLTLVKSILLYAMEYWILQGNNVQKGICNFKQVSLKHRKQRTFVFKHYSELECKFWFALFTAYLFFSLFFGLVFLVDLCERERLKRDLRFMSIAEDHSSGVFNLAKISHWPSSTTERFTTKFKFFIIKKLIAFMPSSPTGIVSQSFFTRGAFSLNHKTIYRTLTSISQ